MPQVKVLVFTCPVLFRSSYFGERRRSEKVMKGLKLKTNRYLLKREETLLEQRLKKIDFTLPCLIVIQKFNKILL
jgi:hypothetical protein